MSLKKKFLLAGAACGLLLSASAWAVPLTLENNWVQAGVSDYGTLGSNGSTPPGILYDPTGTGTYGVNDFLTPGTPFEGFYLTSDQGGWYGNNDWSSNYGTWVLTQVSQTEGTAEATSTDGSVKTRHEYQLIESGGIVRIAIKTTITNESAAPITNLKFLRTLDPDPDVNVYDDYDTKNVVVSAARACGTGLSTDQTICIDTAGSPYTFRAGVSEDWSTDPSAYLGGLNDGDGDYAIGLAFDIGTLAAGASAVLEYSYILSETSSGVVPTGSVTAVPTLEAWGLGLLSGGMVLLAAVRRRKSRSTAA